MAFFDRVALFAHNLVASQQIATSRLSAVDLAYVARDDELVPDDLEQNYQLYENYYAGKQRDPRNLNDPTEDTLHNDGPYFAPRHNVCSVVVDVMLERLHVTGATVAASNSDADMTEVAAQLWRWWQQNRMDAHQTTVHAGALIDGDSYVLVSFDTARNIPRFTPLGADMMTPVYDAQHTMTHAFAAYVETYTDDKNTVRFRQRVTKYSPGLIEKFAREDQRAWELYTADVDADGNPDGGVIAWVDGLGQPLGIPVVHFKNKPRGQDFGRSELADVVPMQDELNRRIFSASQGAAFQGSAQKWLTNVVPPIDPTTKQPTSFFSGADTILTLNPLDPAKPVGVGQWQPGDVTQLQDAADRELKVIAGLTGTPTHLLYSEGTLPSGEALKTAEARLTAKCEDRSVTFGNGWEDCLALAVRVWNAFGAGDALPDPATLTISAEWAPFGTRSELVDEQVLALKADDLSHRQRMRERGYSEDEIDRIAEEKDAETPAGLQQADQFAQRALAPQPAIQPQDAGQMMRAALGAGGG